MKQIAALVTLSLIFLYFVLRVWKFYKLWISEGRDPKKFPKALWKHCYKRRHEFIFGAMNVGGIVVTCLSVF